jgi:hypothetical protein
LKYLKAELSVSDTIMSSLVKDLLGNLFGTNIKKSLKNLAEPNLTLAQVTHTNLAKSILFRQLQIERWPE